jgi:hypothetical protein
MVLCNVMTCNLADRHQHFGGSSYLYLQGFLRHLNSSKIYLPTAQCHTSDGNLECLGLKYAVMEAMDHHLLYLNYEIYMPCSDIWFKNL